MCILYVMIEPDPRPGGLRLVVCSIRDEFFQRPAALAHEWPNENGGAKLLGGMDMQKGVQGGTWLAMDMITGDIAALLNIREPKPLAYAEIGRGFLVVDYLKAAPEQKRNYLDELKENSDRYNGFSLVTIDRNGAGEYSLSSFSNRSNCLKRNQSDQRSYVITNSLRPDYPFYRGIVFKREFDTILAECGLMNARTGDDPSGSVLNIGRSSVDRVAAGEKQAVEQETKQAAEQEAEQATERVSKREEIREKKQAAEREVEQVETSRQAAKGSGHQQAAGHAGGNNAANLNNDQTNEQTNAQINDSLDNRRDCPSDTVCASRASRSGHVDRVKDRKLAEDFEDCPPTACAEKRADRGGDCAKRCSRDCSLAISDQRDSNDNKTGVNDRANRPDKPIDFGEPAAQQQLIRSLLDVMLSPRNYYEQEKNGDYFRSQTCLSNELCKRAIASLCISLPEHDYGSRTFTIILVDAENQVNYYEWTRERVGDCDINHELDRHFQFTLA